jgi:hypothetical protein
VTVVVVRLMVIVLTMSPSSSPATMQSVTNAGLTSSVVVGGEVTVVRCVLG